MMIDWTRHIVFCVIVVWAAIVDIRTKYISSRLLAMSSVIGLALCLCCERNVWEVVCSCALGIVILGISYVTRGGVGEGDGWFFVMAGLYLDWQENVGLFLSGLCLCFWVSLIIVAVRKGRKTKVLHDSLPFLPFLVPSAVIMAIW